MRERVIMPELLEAAGSPAALANRRDLHRINTWFGGYAIAHRLVGEFCPTRERVRILDVGAAWGDLGRSLRRSFPLASVTSCDIHPAHLTAAGEPRVRADAFRLPFRCGGFDLVICSLFLHHFTSDKVVELLREMNRVANRGVLAIDLQRHPLSRGFLPATRLLFGWHRVTLHDGPVSVAAAFDRDELRRLGEEAGLSGARVRKHAPWFRLSLVHRK